MTMKYRNTWGSPESGTDQQRADLFQVEVALPKQLRANSGVGVWSSHVGWAVEKFPFPARGREAVPIKYLQQTNFQIGADMPLDPIEMTVRYAFNQRAAELLERWWWLVGNPKTGGVALSSAIKTWGMFYWLIPNSETAGIEGAAESSAYKRLRSYKLEGCWLKDFKPATEADMTAGNTLVNLSFVMQIDRYYPEFPEDLRVLDPNSTSDRIVSLPTFP